MIQRQTFDLITLRRESHLEDLPQTRSRKKPVIVCQQKNSLLQLLQTCCLQPSNRPIQLSLATILCPGKSFKLFSMLSHIQAVAKKNTNLRTQLLGVSAKVCHSLYTAEEFHQQLLLHKTFSFKECENMGKFSNFCIYVTLFEKYIVDDFLLFFCFATVVVCSSGPAITDVVNYGRTI